MKISDIIALARAGYKLDEIKALEEKEKEEPTVEEPTVEEPTVEEPTVEEPTLKGAEDEKIKSENPPQTSEAVEDLKKQLADAKEALKKAQTENINKDIKSDIKSDDDILAETIKGFM